MTKKIETISSLFEKQQSFYGKGRSSSYEWRYETLGKLKKAIERNKGDIHLALKHDLNKSEAESLMSETGQVIREIDHALKYLKKWMKKRRVSTSAVNFPGKSYLVPRPIGPVLVISPWNYPFYLLFAPLVGAIAAGNPTILKPSEISENVSKVIKKIIDETFDSEELAVVLGGIPETTELLELPFSHIFYTGNGTVGKIVMEKAAKNLVPVTLELGGKSPCVVSGDENVALAAKRVVWGKFFNAGQTCVAPDYLLIKDSLKESFIRHFKYYLKEFYGERIVDSQDYGRIINNRHFNRLKSLIGENDKVIVGGEMEESSSYISPTMVEVSSDSALMEGEIFGPILPVISFSRWDEAMEMVSAVHEKPLAAYLFESDREKQQDFVEKVEAGGVCINDTLVHLNSHSLPFGGNGPSGMGAYHGKFSFDTFTHYRPVMIRSFRFDMFLRYPPYFKNLKLLSWVIKFIRF